MVGARDPAENVEVTDVELVNQLVAGKLEVFPIFYRKHSRLIRHCIAKRTHLPPDDLLQDFFLKLQVGAYRALDRWNRETPFSGYLSFIVKNFVIDAYRADADTASRRRKPARGKFAKWATPISSGDAQVGDEISNDKLLWRQIASKPHRGDEGAEDEEESISGWHAPPDTRLESRELRRRGILAWSRLSSERDRRLICGKFHRETPADAAATAEGLSPGTFRKAIFDAQKRYTASLRLVAPEFYG